MSTFIRKHLQIDFAPVAEPAATATAGVQAGAPVRFTVLTSRLLRLEHSPTGSFEDRPSQAFWYRRQPVPEFQVTRRAPAEGRPERLEIVTAHLHLRYDITARGFHRNTLSVELKESGTVWRYGDKEWPHNLLGTARTLDRANGAVRLEAGLMSRAGWAVVDDSASLVFDEDGWLAPRSPVGTADGTPDLYFFGYGHDYLGCLQDFCHITGPMPLIPRWMLGNWWSRYWAYSQDELQALMEEFRNHQIPLSVCIVDMDWHLTETGNACSGWTGYTWNRALFPDPEGFMTWLHDQGLRTALNLHPAEGVHPHETQYAPLAQRLGVDPALQEPVPFDLADPRFASAYFELLHHPLEAQGVDFWWLDWQQGTLSRLPGLDPLWWLNHLHYRDSGRDGGKRPVIFSRWGGLGNHRYPIGFSGDTVTSWESLAFQPYFTATAANVGYGWWSHDIGGHWGGIEDPELYTRWVQYGVFSPILRLHSTKNPYHERRPWGWNAEVLRVTREAMQLRHALIPYLYSAAWRCAVDTRPLCLPMYYRHPQDDAAYHCPNQYYFGSELIAAPFVAPADPDVGLSRQSVWLPQGTWFDFFTGEPMAGSRWHMVYGGLQDIPVFARAGAIVPMGPAVGWGGVDNPPHLTLRIYPAANGRFELYEDDGETQAYGDGHYCLTTFEQKWQRNTLTFIIAPASGDPALVPAERSYDLLVFGVSQPHDVVLAINGAHGEYSASYDAERHTLACKGITLRPSDTLELRLSGIGLERRDNKEKRCRRLLQAFRLDAKVKQEIDRDLPHILSGGSSLMHHANHLRDSQLQALLSVLAPA